MTSERAVYLLGVVFTYDATGRVVPSGPPGVNLREAVAERLDAVRARRNGGPSQDGGARWGTCDTCGQPLGTVCNRLCCRPSSSRSATFEKRHASCCHDLGVDSRPVPGPPARCFEAHGSNKSGTCWLCVCAGQKLLALGESPTRAPEAVVQRAAAVAAGPVAAPWEASGWDLGAYRARLRAIREGEV